MSNEQLVEQIKNGADNRHELLLELFEDNRRLIYQTVKPYIIPGKTEEEDAMQEGFIGLLDAVEHYEPERGAFSTALVFWVRSTVGRWHQDTRDLMRIPSYMQNLMYRYKRYCQRFRAEHGYQPSNNRILRELGISPERLEDIKRCFHEGEFVSLDDIVLGTEDLTVESTVPDITVDVEGEVVAAVDFERDAVKLWDAVNDLSGAQPEVLKHRYIEQQSLTGTAEIMGITRGKVERAELYALRSLRSNKTVRQVGKRWGYPSSLYKGNLRRFKETGSSVVEETAIKRVMRERNSQPETLRRYLALQKELRKEMEELKGLSAKES